MSNVIGHCSLVIDSGFWFLVCTPLMSFNSPRRRGGFCAKGPRAAHAGGGGCAWGDGGCAAFKILFVVFFGVGVFGCSFLEVYFFILPGGGFVAAFFFYTKKKTARH